MIDFTKIHIVSYNVDNVKMRVISRGFYRDHAKADLILANLVDVFHRACIQQYGEDVFFFTMNHPKCYEIRLVYNDQILYSIYLENDSCTEDHWEELKTVFKIDDDGSDILDEDDE